MNTSWGEPFCIEVYTGMVHTKLPVVSVITLFCGVEATNIGDKITPANVRSGATTRLKCLKCEVN